MFDDQAAPAASPGAAETPPVRRRSGSQKRRKTAAVRVPCLPSQRAELDELAARAGQPVSVLCLNALLGLPLPPKRHRPAAADSLAVVRLSGVMGQFKSELSRVGSNLNQVAHHLNAGRDETSLQHTTAATVMELQAAVAQIQADIRPACVAILEALGLRPAKDDQAAP